MEYSDSYLREVLPREDPPEAYVPAEVNEEIARWFGREEVEDQALVARSTRWTYALFNELRLNQGRVRWQPSPYWPFDRGWHLLGMPLTVGLFDQQTEERGFGLIAHVPQEADRGSFLGPFAIVADVEFPRLRATFPFAFRQGAYVDHALIHPQIATASSWARCNTTRLWGVLTAGHAIGGTSPGKIVPLDDGTTGYLVRSHHPPIDAAFVNTAPPPASQPLSIRRFPATGQPVLGDLKSGPDRRTVVHVDSAMGVVNTRVYPVQLFLNAPFAPGDSGALIRTPGHEAVGIYLGSLVTPQVPGGFAGRALNFEQATLALDVTAFL